MTIDDIGNIDTMEKGYGGEVVGVEDKVNQVSYLVIGEVYAWSVHCLFNVLPLWNIETI